MGEVTDHNGETVGCPGICKSSRGKQRYKMAIWKTRNM